MNSLLFSLCLYHITKAENNKKIQEKHYFDMPVWYAYLHGFTRVISLYQNNMVPSDKTRSESLYPKDYLMLPVPAYTLHDPDNPL